MTLSSLRRASLLAGTFGLIAATGLAACGGTGGLEVAATVGPATATSPAGLSTAPSGTRTLSDVTTGEAGLAAEVYFLRGGRVSPVRRLLSAAAGQSGIWPELVTDLLRGPSSAERETGTSTAFARAGGSSFDFDNLSVNPTSGIASIDLPASFGDGTVQAVRERLAQLVFTLTQSPDVSGVSVSVAGRSLTSIPGVGAPERPLDRNDFEAETTPILVESPLPGDVPSCPLRIAGTANTFEGTFLVVLLDGSGRPVATPRNVTATSGSGTRGTFEVSLPCPSGTLPGRVAAYTECVTGEGLCSPSRGANRVEIPLGTLTR